MTAPPAESRIRLWLATRADDDMLRGLFAVMLVATLTVAGLDYHVLMQASAKNAPAQSPGLPGGWPAAEPLPPRRGGEEGRPAPLRRPDASLQGRMRFDLQADGRLIATGTIMPGSADEFAAEVAKRGGYVKTVALHSPGGSLGDALAMGRLIRERGFATEVGGGGYCASACPLVFAGGVERRAGTEAAIGVHRAVAVSATPLRDAEAMEEGQRISATCQKYLREMGIDLAVWIHAMETPNDQLYYFKPDELMALKLATAVGNGKARTAGR